MANPVFLSIIGKKNEKRALKREVVFDFQRKRLLKLRKRLLPSSGLTCSTLTYAKGLDVRFEKVSKDTSIENSTNGWPIILFYEGPCTGPCTFALKAPFYWNFIIWRRQIIFALKTNGKISKNCQNSRSPCFFSWVHKSYLSITKITQYLLFNTWIREA